MPIDYPDDEPRTGMVSTAIFDGSNRRIGLPAPDHWYPWVTELFPSYASAPFAQRHADFWDWVWALEKGVAPALHDVEIWPRGGGKTTGAELATVCVGCRGRRNYAWYIRATQENADTSVQNIAGLLESDAIARHYPDHSDRELSKFGFSKGWKVNRLRTAGGFIVDAIGLDTAKRGVKVDEHRPDFFIIDDIDGKHDTTKTALKKIQIITNSLLPAMARHGAVLSIQNLIIRHGFFARMVTGQADYLAKRRLSGPHPAITGLEVGHRRDPETGVNIPYVKKGKATWAGQTVADCDHLLATAGEDSFVSECQHDVFGKKEGVALRFEEAVHVEDLTDDKARELVRGAIRSRTMSVFGGIDFGAWRFAFTLWAVDSNGIVHQLSEYFSQRQDKQKGMTLPSSLAHRAKAIDAIMTHYGCPANTPIWGDVANQTDILEINLGLGKLKSKYSVVGVAGNLKARATSVERLNNLLDSNELKFRRDVVESTAKILEVTFKEHDPHLFREWREGYTSTSPGVINRNTSRLRWEVKEWSYTPTEEGDEQDQDVADESADGADCIAAMRYPIMSWWVMTKDPLAGIARGEDHDRTQIIAGNPKLRGTDAEQIRQLEQQFRATVETRRRSIFTRKPNAGSRKIDL